jgi:type IV secretion system protein VirB5
MNRPSIPFALLFTFAALGGAPCLRAQGIPVIDVQGVIQQALSAARALEQIQQLAKQYETQIEQLTAAQEQRDALRGSRGLGQLLNTSADQAARRALPPTVEELLRIARTGKVPRSYEEIRVLSERLARELTLEPGLRGEGAPSGTARTSPQQRVQQQIERTRATTLANATLAEKAYQDANRRVQAYDRMLQQIDRTPDLKASADLSNRIQAENGFGLAELTRLIALQLGGTANAAANELAARENVSKLGAFNEKRFDQALSGAALRVPASVSRNPSLR